MISYDFPKDSMRIVCRRVCKEKDVEQCWQEGFLGRLARHLASKQSNRSFARAESNFATSPANERYSLG